MSEPQSTPGGSGQPAPPVGMQPLPGRRPSSAAAAFRTLPRWLRIGIIAAGAAVLALGISVLVRVALQTPFVPQGVTAAESLLPGSCLREPGQLDEYMVVGCGSPHQQQVIASVDLEFPGVPYSSDDGLAIYATTTCERLLEYRLYLPSDLERADYRAVAIAPPTLEQYESGDTETLCAVLDDPDRPAEGGVSADLTSDLYRPIPK